MNMAMLLAVFGVRQRITQTFNANTTWNAPSSTATLISLVGKGAAGAPGVGGTPGTPGRTGYQITFLRTYQKKAGGTEQTSSISDPIFDSAMPGNYCDPTEPITDSEVYSSSTLCYLHSSYREPGEPGTTGTNPTTGASATGFGKTFPGGTGGQASPVTYNNVPVVPSTPYPLVIPDGGSITITYYQ